MDELRVVGVTDFEGHLKLGLGGGLLATAAVAFLMIDSGRSIPIAAISGSVAFLILVVGSILPDVDHHASKPRQYLGLGAIGVFSIGGVYLYTSQQSIRAMITNFLIYQVGVPQFLAPASGMAMLALVGVILAPVAMAAFDHYTTHRGLTHTHYFGVVFGFLVAFLVSQIPVLPPEMVIVAFVVGAAGVFIHFGVGDRN